MSNIRIKTYSTIQMQICVEGKTNESGKKVTSFQPRYFVLSSLLCQLRKIKEKIMSQEFDAKYKNSSYVSIVVWQGIIDNIER